MDFQRLQLHIQRDTATRAATSLGLGIRESIAWVSRVLAATTRRRRNIRGLSRNPFKNQDGDGHLLRLPAQRGGEFEICLRRFGVSLIRYTPSSSVHRLTVAWQDSEKEAGASSNANSRHGHEEPPLHPAVDGGTTGCQATPAPASDPEQGHPSRRRSADHGEPATPFQGWPGGAHAIKVRLVGFLCLATRGH